MKIFFILWFLAAGAAGAEEFLDKAQTAQLDRVESESVELAERAWRARIRSLAAEALAKAPFRSEMSSEPELVSTIYHRNEPNGEKQFIHSWKVDAPGKSCRFASEGWDYNGRYDARVGRVYGMYCLPR